MINRFALHILFSIYLVVGLFLVPDYGVAWDDWIMRDSAIRNTEYAVAFFNGADERHKEIFEGNIDEHGPVIQLILYAAEKLFEPSTTHSLFLLRHYITFLLFAFLSLGFYKLLRLANFSNSLALLGWIVLVAYPRVFAHSMFNSKDPLLMVLFVWVAFSLVNAIRTRKWKWHLLFGLSLGFITDIRVLSLVFLLPYGVYWSLSFMQGQTIKKNALKAATVMVAIILMAVVAWPFLWHDPINSFLNQFKVITEVKQPNSTLFFGEFYLPKQAPRWYLPLYLLITIPLAIWLFILLGVYTELKRFFANSVKAIMGQELFYISLCIVLVPVLASIVLKPVFYNGWRHFQFIFPFLLIIALYGFKSISWSKQFKPIHIGLASILLLGINAALHPYGSTYFNFWMGKDLEQKFECDYWGVNFISGWEFLANNTKGQINVFVSDLPAKHNLQLLNSKEQERFTIVHSLQEADYVLTNHNHFQDFTTPLWHQFYFGEHRIALGVEEFKAGSYQASSVRVYRLR